MDSVEDDNLEEQVASTSCPQSSPKSKKLTAACKCPHCPESFSKPFNLKRHIERMHASVKEMQVADISSGNCSCQTCSYKCRRIVDLRKHLSEEHNQVFRSESITFNSYPEFLQWKTQLEEKENCSFVKPTGDKRVVPKDTQVQYFQCNRSGNSREVNTSDVKRRQKSQGSSKIEFNCTATMTVKLTPSGQVDVSVCYDHYGHKMTLEHVRIPTPQREVIAAKLQQGVSKDRILDDIREDFTSDFQRHHIIEKQDIANIERAFGLKSVQRHANDSQSTLAWINEWEETRSSPVLFIKFQGEEAEDGYDLTKDDFCMVVQTPFQREMLQKFGNKGVCCDSTHGTNGYDFPLTTIHVVDEYGQGIPVAWCLSSHEDQTTMVIFFKEVRKNCGNIKSDFFMSDMANQFYNAWVAVMDEGPRPKKLLCTWHVDKAWKEELRKKVGDATLESEVYQLLRTCLEQTAQVNFEDCLEGLLKRLESDSKTQSFHSYFEKEWVTKKEQWAFCFRLNCTMNTNMFAEAFHRVFKRVYLKGKVNRRVDVCLFNLVKFSRDKAFERAIKLTKGKVTYRTSVIAAQHKESLGIPAECVQVDESGTGKWFVQGQRMHEVIMVSSHCTEKSLCQMVCPDCSVCIHMFECNCSDSLIVGTICKHIHAVWGQVASAASHQPEAHSAKLAQAELKSLSSYVKNVSHSDPSIVKERIKEKMFSINAEIAVCNDLNALSALEKQLSVAYNNFAAAKKHGCTSADLSPQCSSPANKNMDTQRRFYSTKRKRKSRALVRYTRPTAKEKELYFNMLTASHSSKSAEGIPFTLAEHEVLQFIITPGALSSLVTTGKLITATDIIDEELPGDLLDAISDDKLQQIERFLSKDAWTKLNVAVEALQVSWTCSSCKEAQFKEMIACDLCESWHHWCCVGVTEEPESWCCQSCTNTKL